jgi:hypothetical protein
MSPAPDDLSDCVGESSTILGDDWDLRAGMNQLSTLNSH